MNGYGKRTYSDGSSFEGLFQNGLREGNGKIIYGPGNRYAFYEGNYHEDKKSGYGKMTFPDGAIYEGFWKNGVREGSGRMTYPQTSLYSLYEGEYHNEQKNGFGKMVYKNGFVFEGTWKNNYERLVIGFSGISTSGKSTVATALCSRFPGAVTFTSDKYFLPESTFRKIRFDGVDIPNWEEPSTVDWDRLAQDIENCPARLIFVDSFLLFAHAPIWQQLRAAVVVRYQHTPEDLVIAARRRAERHSWTPVGALDMTAAPHGLRGPHRTAVWYRDVVWAQAWKPELQWAWDGSRTQMDSSRVLNISATDDLGANIERAYQFVAQFVPPTLRR